MSILLSSLLCTHLCIKIKKVHTVGVASFAQNYWAKGATLRENLFGL